MRSLGSTLLLAAGGQHHHDMRRAGSIVSCAQFSGSLSASGGSAGGSGTASSMGVRMTAASSTSSTDCTCKGGVASVASGIQPATGVGSSGLKI